MRLVKTAEQEPSLTDDPKPRDRVTWQRMRIAVEHEACHRDWGCALYTLHRTGRINNDQREAGDKYAALIRDYRKLWCDPIGFAIDIPNQERDYDVRCKETAVTTHALGLAQAESVREESEFETRRAQRISKRYREAKGIAGQANGILEDLLIDETWPTGQRCHVEIAHALTRLSHFFVMGTKRKHKK
jgi:hypothetical protein